MAVLITDPDLPQKFAAVEGYSAEALERELASTHANSLGHAIREYDRQRDEYIQFDLNMGETLETINLSASLGFVIYGDGGWNRYYVRVSGEVCFSKHHAAWPKDESIADAQAAGFDLFE